MQRFKDGFTIPEMLVSLTLMSLLLGVAMVNFHAPRDRADVKGASVVLASNLRQARQQAMSEGRPVAIAFATNNGALNHSSGFYKLVGETRPQMVTRTSFATEYHGASIFCGQYGGFTWSTTYPTALNLDNFVLNNWNIPYPQDHVITFLPSGLAVSDLPLGNGAYRLIVAKSFSYSGSPALLSSAQEARTVSILPTGEVSEDNKIPGASGVAEQIGNSGDGAAIPAVASANNHTPTLVTPFIKMNPEVNTNFLNMVAAGATATIPEGGMLTFRVYATDQDGDQLWCKWSGQGTFAAQDGARMVWNEENKYWVGEWSWKVPASAKAGDKFVLNCNVYDNRGGITTPVDVGLTMPTMAVIQSQTVLAAMLNGLYAWNWDGSGARLLVSSQAVGKGLITKVRWSPDHNTIAFVAGNSIYTCSPTGLNIQKITSYPLPALSNNKANKWLQDKFGITVSRSIDAICWAPDGLNLYVLVNDELHQLIVDPTLGMMGDKVVASSLGQDCPSRLSMHPNGKLLLTSDYSSLDPMAIWLAESSPPNNTVKVERIYSKERTDGMHGPVFNTAGTSMQYQCAEPDEGWICALRADVEVDTVNRKFTYKNEKNNLESTLAGSSFGLSPDGLYTAGTIESGYITVCPSTADLGIGGGVDITPIPPKVATGVDNSRIIVDMDWGFY